MSKSRKNKLKLPPKRADRFVSKLKPGSFRDVPIVVEPDDEVKISEVLVDFVAPYRDVSDTIDIYRRMVIFAATAWNASLIPDKIQQEAIDDIFTTDKFPEADGLELKRFLRMLIIRKKTHFARYRRFILAVEYLLNKSGQRGPVGVVVNRLEGT
jgi:hypothetical protein